MKNSLKDVAPMTALHVVLTVLTAGLWLIGILIYYTVKQTDLMMINNSILLDIAEILEKGKKK